MLIDHRLQGAELPGNNPFYPVKGRKPAEKGMDRTLLLRGVFSPSLLSEGVGSQGNNELLYQPACSRPYPLLGDPGSLCIG